MYANHSISLQMKQNGFKDFFRGEKEKKLEFNNYYHNALDTFFAADVKKRVKATLLQWRHLLIHSLSISFADQCVNECTMSSYF